MAQQIIDVGNVANDGTGDPLRTAFQIVNDNFTETYNPSYLANGSSRVDVLQDGDILMSSNGVANVMVVSSTQVTITGDLAVTGNAILSGNILGDRIQNGNTIVDIQSPGGNANITIGNVTNVAVFAPTGQYINGLLSVSGNITGNTLTTLSVVTNEISSNSNPAVSILDNLNVSGTISATGNITGDVLTGNVLSGTTLSAAGNVVAGNLTTSGLISATGNITGGNLIIGSGSTGNAIIYGNLTVYGNTTTINSNTVTTNDLNITVGNNQNTGAALNNAGIDVGNNNLATWRYNDSTTSWQTNLAITPTGNAAQNLGGPSNFWNNVYANNVNLNGSNIGNVAIVNFDGNIANVLLGSGTFGNTPATLGALNYVQNSVSTTQSVYTSNTFPYSVVSASITTNGNPVQIIVSGDANPLSAGGFGIIQLYRDSTAIGQPVQYESSASNENVPYALQVIDVPPVPGTYTYALKVNSLTANAQFGENSGPVLSAIEIQNVKGNDGAPYAWRTIAANGTNIISNVSDGVLTYTPGNNIIITGNATSNVVTFAVPDAPTFTGNVTGANLVGNLISTTASVSGNATIGNANIGLYTTNALRVNGTGYIINSATTDPYPNTGTLDVAAVTQPNVVIRGFSQTTSGTSGPVLQFVRKQQTGFSLASGYDAGRMKFWAIQPNNDTYNYIGEVAGITTGSGTDGQLEFYSGLANVPQLALTLDSTKTATFSGNIIPSANVTYSLGNATNWWSSAYFGASTIYIGGVAVGTSGSQLTVAGNNVVTANATGTSTTTGNVSITGNITAGNFVTDGTTGSLSVNSIAHTGTNAVGNIGSSSTYFNRVFAASTSAIYSDLAENYTADADYAPGTVMSIGGTQELTKSLQDGDRAVVGVVSTNPSYTMNSGLESEFVVTVALTGRVPCLVQGPIKRGDLLISAGNGRARAEDEPRVGSVLGKALADFNGDVGTIEIVIGKH